jgi:glucose/arabinose dehydrogenase
MKGQHLLLGSLILIGLWACKNEEDGNVLTPPLMEEPDVETSIRPEMIISGFNHPWGMAFIDEDTWLLTERNGDLLLIDKGISQVLNHGLEVQYGGQGGLLDIRVAPDFSQSGWIYLTYAKKGNNNTSTLALVRFKVNGGQVEGMEELFEALPYHSGNLHYGSRIAFDENGHIFVSLGDRYHYGTASSLSNPGQSFPQDLTKHWGKIIRLNLDGSIPADNPFVDQPSALPEIYSYGHRNPQGIAFDKRTNQIFVNEHGARGGDEINLIEAGKNYGWPVITYGRDYNGRTIGEGTSKSGMEQPLIYYDPSVAPSSHLIYTGNVYSAWSGDHFMSTLADQSLIRLTWDGAEMVQQEMLFPNSLGRIRHIAQSPAGFIYLLIDADQGGIVKLVTD